MAQKTKFSLTEKIAIINIYELIRNKFTRQDNIQKLADMFNCPIGQIGCFLLNDPVLLEKKKEKLLQSDAQLKQIEECVYEYIQRVQYHRKVPLTPTFIRSNAKEFRNLMNFSDFTANKKWFSQFRVNYNISLSQKKRKFTRKPPASLNLNNIIQYCRKNFSRNASKIEVKESHEELNPSEEARWDNIGLELLELTLKEYMKRVRVHHKSIELDDAVLKQVALELNAILKLSDFYPYITWLQDVKKTQITKEEPANEIPLSLNLMDILSYCCRMAPVRRRTLDNGGVKSSLILNMYQKVQRYSVVAESLGVEPNVVKKIIENNTEVKLKSNVQQEYNRIRKNLNNSDIIHLASKITEKNLLSIAEDKKFELLEKCVYEALRRKKGLMNMESIATIALDFRDIMELQDFKANKRWLNHFKYKYNIQFSNQEHVPPESVDLHDVLEYCKLSFSNYKDVLLVLKPVEEYAILNQNYEALMCIGQLERHLKNTYGMNAQEICR